MIVDAAAAGLLGCAAGAMAWAVRGRSSGLLAPSRWRGPKGRKQIALTFDDGPSESTPDLLEILAIEGAKATFFQCGRNVERLPAISRMVHKAGHELGNHTYSHSPLYLRHAGFIRDELALGQEAIERASGVRPIWFRAPYGCRWFGLREAQRELGLTGVMWTCIGLDWKRNADEIVRRLSAATHDGAVFCLHDARELQPQPDIRATVEAVRRLIPLWKAKGYSLVTLSEMFSE